MRVTRQNNVLSSLSTTEDTEERCSLRSDRNALGQKSYGTTLFDALNVQIDQKGQIDIRCIWLLVGGRGGENGHRSPGERSK